MGIRQLASELRLSIGTVSRALNDRPDVNAETRARVKAAAARMGYVPNQSGRSLRSGRTGIVAAVIPTAGLTPNSDVGLFTVLEGARRTLRRHSLDLILLFRGPDEDPLENLQRIVQRRIADAVIITHTTARDPRLAYLMANGVEYTSFGRSDGFDDYSFVDFDFAAMAREAAQVMVRDGHRRLALAPFGALLNYEAITLESFRAEARRLGLAAAAVEVLPMCDGRLTEPGRALFLSARTAPTAILATHECIAGGLYADLGALGLRIGHDVSVICIFPVLDARSLVPALSHFEADLDAVGVALAEQLVSRRSDLGVKPRPAGPALIPLTFVPRASHGRPGRAAAAAAAAAPQGLVQAPPREEERTQASTKATPATPSSIVG
jgi:DNA-binding LacI/PurR family transcriptional regulator